MHVNNGSGPCVTLSWLQSQHYVVCPLEDKINMLYSFIKTHLKSKTIVFVSACKQCRFLHEAMRRIRPGVSVMALHGKQKQKQRSLIYLSFVRFSGCAPCSRSLSFISPLSAHDHTAACSWRSLPLCCLQPMSLPEAWTFQGLTGWCSWTAQRTLLPTSTAWAALLATATRATACWFSSPAKWMQWCHSLRMPRSR